MENVKLPDLSRVRYAKQRLKKLPPQKSASDTSNWENRNVSAPIIDVENKKHTVRNLDFIRPEETLQALTLDQIKKLKAQDRPNKSS